MTSYRAGCLVGTWSDTEVIERGPDVSAVLMGLIERLVPKPSPAEIEPDHKCEQGHCNYLASGWRDNDQHNDDNEDDKRY